MEFKNLENALNTYGKMVVEGYKDRLQKGDKNASGNLSNSVKYQIERNGTVYEVSLSLEHYWKYVENGRRAGKFPPISAIEKWIKVKPVIPRAYNGKVPSEKQLAFLIARKIATEGIKPQPLLRNTLDDTKDDALKMIEEAFMKDLEGNIDEVLLIFKSL